MKITRIAIFAASLMLLGWACSGPTLAGPKNSDVLTDVDEDVRQLVISGRLVDQQQKPVADVDVVLFEPGGSLTMESRSAGDGSFKFKHKACGELSLQVAPDKGLRLAEAFIENLPGEETRKLIVELKRGYLVSGAVTHRGKGLKGVMVRVRPVGAKDKRTLVHGGGTAETAKNGGFEIVLTEGRKKMIVINNKYPDLEKQVEKEFGVADDTHLGKIELP